ncbi:MAG: ABC transporter permease [Butyrivibrio sp.]|nr:ABC transporter permease [Muribaculum sp.]MCM1551185.1 ABC transporter permease [Butyrivibrio sp.]
MNVKNRPCIRRLSMRQLMASKTRNLIAVFAIALTTMLFTSLFTIVMSINASYEEYNFRQVGGYCHGTFKDVDETKIENLAKHSKVKEYGLRTVCGFAVEEPFAKVPAEISWMDANTTKWSYALPTTGRMPESGMEIAMDTAALRKLGLPAQVGTQVELTYARGNDFNTGQRQSDVFTLVGFWEYDNLMPVHYINISQEYMEQMQEENLAAGGGEFRTDMNVMLTSRLNIEATMKEIDTDLGYQWLNRDAEDSVRIGVNWGYSTEELGNNLDATTILALAAFLILIIFTGYLIIYNIFQISVSTDIRFYGLLKTIGATPRQLRRMVRLQALYLSVVGIPIGCVLGYAAGCVLSPIVISNSTISVTKNSVSPMIFVGAIIFSLVTVLISCSRPGKMAARITPVEAVRYVENNTVSRKRSNKRRAARGAGIGQMAFANLGRNRTKTVLVVLSLSLAVVLLNIVVIFVESFDSEKYIAQFSATDFLVGTPKYFHYEGMEEDAALAENAMEDIRENTSESLQGAVYSLKTFPNCWVSEEVFRANSFYGGEVLEQQVELAQRQGDLLKLTLQVEALDDALVDKLVVYEGELAPLRDASVKAIAVAASMDDSGRLESDNLHLGDRLPVTYTEYTITDSRTGEPCGEEVPVEFWEVQEEIREEEYTVCALVGIPYGLSYRFSLNNAVKAILTSDALRQDSGQELHAMLYAFDTPDETAEADAEAFLADYTAGESSDVMYESKALLREDFESFRDTFLILGGALSFIVGLVGVLNFFNAILTGIVTRRHEFAMLQSVGMTGGQLQKMLMYEGIFYAVSAGGLSLLLCLAFRPLVQGLLENTFWFISFRYTLAPVLCAVPVFFLLGALLPLIVYRFTKGRSIVERLRENE